MRQRALVAGRGVPGDGREVFGRVAFVHGHHPGAEGLAHALQVRALLQRDDRSVAVGAQARVVVDQAHVRGPAQCLRSTASMVLRDHVGACPPKPMPCGKVYWPAISAL
jgi:hypothetical protein